jgi:triacylglycerol lipase
MHELIEDALGDPQNCMTLAWASEYSYLPEADGKAKFRSEMGMNAKLISVDNTQAYVLTNDDHIVVAFRGTEGPTNIDGLKDWLLTDAVNLLIVPEGRLGTDLIAAGVGARFHQGFVNAIGEIWEPVFQAAKAEMDASERPLWLTGHSLGGALALISGWLFIRKMIPVHQIYTYGGPMIGNAAAVKAIDKEFKGKIFRCVNLPDPVPQLPTMSLIANQYGHCEQEILLGAKETAENAAAAFSLLAKKAVDGVLNATIIEDLWKDVTGRIAAHNMDQYRTHLTGYKKS